MEINTILDEYFSLESQIREYFGCFSYDSLEDYRDKVWFILGNSIVFANNTEDLLNVEAGYYYTNCVITEYREGDLTLIEADTQMASVGTILMVLSNKNEYKGEVDRDSY